MRMVENKKDSEIFVKKCRNYEESEKVIKEILEESNFYKEIKDNDLILLKPNLLMSKNKGGVTLTNPIFVENIIKVLMQKISANNIFIGDSPAFGSTRTAIYGSEYIKIIEKYKINMLEFKETDFQDGQIFKKIPILKDIKNFKIINIPKVKTHSLMLLTCATKNLFGFVIGNEKGKYHAKLPTTDDFGLLIYDIGKTIKPHFTIIDAIEGMEGEGPSSGKKKFIGYVIAGNNVFELDYIVCKMVSINPYMVSYLNYAIKNKDIDMDKLNKYFTKIKIKSINFELPSTYSGKSKFIFNTRKLLNNKIIKNFLKKISEKPKVDKEKCIGCAICEKSCPVKAIKLVNSLPTFDYNKCIRCFCCHEMCPQGAIFIEKGLISKVLR